MQAIFETLFDIVYLVTVITLSILIIRNSRGEKQYLLYGIMAVTLGCGDAFHLVPRAIALCTTGLENYTAALGIGKLVTSVTMTLFYVLLYCSTMCGASGIRSPDGRGQLPLYGCWRWPASLCASCRRTPGQARPRRAPGAFTATFPLPSWAR